MPWPSQAPVLGRSRGAGVGVRAGRAGAGSRGPDTVRCGPSLRPTASTLSPLFLAVELRAELAGSAPSPLSLVLGGAGLGQRRQALLALEVVQDSQPAALVPHGALAGWRLGSVQGSLAGLGADHVGVSVAPPPSPRHGQLSLRGGQGAAPEHGYSWASGVLPRCWGPRSPELSREACWRPGWHHRPSLLVQQLTLPLTPAPVWDQTQRCFCSPGRHPRSSGDGEGGGCPRAGFGDSGAPRSLLLSPGSP